MTTSAIVMLVIAATIIWGGLVLALLHLRRADREDATVRAPIRS